MKTYEGIQCNKGAGGQTITVREIDKVRILHPGPSQSIRDHSPDGFNWGYGGSGPAQTALAILFDHTDDDKLAQCYYQDFKFDVVAGWGPVWSITDAEIDVWLSKQDNAIIVIERRERG